jgi:hypothetical protein
MLSTKVGMRPKFLKKAKGAGVMLALVIDGNPTTTPHEVPIKLQPK